jgi:hypothetical protein
VLVAGAADSTDALEAATSEVEGSTVLATALSGADAEETASEEEAGSEVAGSDVEAIWEVGSPADEAGSEEATAELEGATSPVDEEA